MSEWVGRWVGPWWGRWTEVGAGRWLQRGWGDPGAVRAEPLLAPSRGALEPPIREALLGATGFRTLGQGLAREHGAPDEGGRAAPFFPRLRQNIRVLHEAHRIIARQEAAGRHVSPAGEWLLDNVHLVVAQTREVHDGLPRRYFRSLPVLGGPRLAGLPRVYAMAWAFVAHADSAFDPALLTAFLQGYQLERTLTHGELWALPTTLRVVLVENLRRLAERVAADEAAREAAHRLCDGLAAAPADPPTDAAAPAGRPLDAAEPVGRPSAAAVPQDLFDRLRARGVMRAFALQVMQRLHADSETGSAAAARRREAVRVALALALPDPAAAQAAKQAEQTADNLSVGNVIRSLQLLGSADWRGVITGCSPLMQRLLTLPVFAAERDDTQDLALQALERLARRSRQPEAEVAAQVQRLVAAAPTATAPEAAPLYWLQGAGRPVLHAALGWQPWNAWGTGLAQACALPLLLGVLALASVGLTVAFMALATPAGLSLPAWLVVALLAFWPASEAAIAVTQRLVSESVPPRRLPRLALAGGIPPAHRVLVVLPCLLTDPATIAELALRLERHHLANREAQAQFALLSDFSDADSAHTDADAALLQAALAALDDLNRRSPAPVNTPPRFVLLHRARRWSDSEQRWIGWERKRGKLEQLVALLAQPGAAAEGPQVARAGFIDLGLASTVQPGTPYIVTLDSDTVLPPGALRELVGLAAHPLNQPQLRHDAHQRPRVVSGHGILQPRLVAAWPRAGQATPFHRLFAGATGSDPYNSVASEVYQDLFDEGSFTGKGLLHVAALQAVLAGRLPEGQVLSHDLLEGCIARCGSVSDVALIEPAPSHADVAASRTHRWTRGDWQLLPLLLNARAYGLSALGRWKLADNLRRSLVAPAALALQLLALAGGPVRPWAALALALAAFGAGPLVGAVAGLAPSRDDLALRHFARQAGGELGRTLAGLAWQLVLWLRQSVLVVDAIARALWRSTCSRRGLLQWTTAAAAETAAAQGPRALLRRHARLSLLALALGVALLLAGTPAPVLTLALCLLWAAAPLAIAWASRPQSAATPLPADDRRYLLGVARDTWAWFEQHVGPDSHHLPPDNVQTVPRLMVAQRTSPTNIGLYLLAVASARAFGWIDAAEMAARLQATLDTLDRLPRERGHLLNWTDTHSLQTLLPAYVSTVDSGNLCGHLLAVATACEATPAAPELQARLHTLAARCRVLAEAAEFGFLYDPRRRLLHIGWRVAEQQLDAGHYDLLASESRLASLWAIAKGDVPAAHWAALGRPFQAGTGGVGLRSWSGSMFEYLMPRLVLDEPAGSALDGAAHLAVYEQRRFARLHGVPWGVSESAYAATDRTLAYQYAPQGVPRLALRRTPPDERVVAPYATVLAAMVAPRAAVDNLHALQALHLRGAWGWYEALDYTPERQADGSRSTRVSTFMAHHQGMVLVALADVLLDGAPRRWGMADRRIAAVASLLQERVPLEVARLRDPAPGAVHAEVVQPRGEAGREVQPGAHALQRTQLLGNGRYSVALRANGAGWSRLGEVDLTRWRDDALRDSHGSFVYLQRGRAGLVSLSQHPAPDDEAHYSAHFHSDRVCLNASWPDLRSRCTVWVSPEDDVELRRVELWNTSSRPITLTLFSAWEACLSPARADEMHPAFANLFVSAEWVPQDQALLLARRPRRDDEAAVHAAHFIAQGEGLTAVRALADRSRWLGRLRQPHQPLAGVDEADTPAGPVDTGLDPVAALAMRVTLPPHGTAQFTLATAAAYDRAALQGLVDRYRQPSAVERSSQMSATLSSLQQRERRMAPDDLVAMQHLTTLLVLLHSRPPAGPAEACDRRALWRFGLSGDRPMIVVSLSTLQGLRLVRALVQGLLHWAHGRVGCELVLVNAEPASYLMPLQRELLALRERHAAEAPPGGTPRGGNLVVLLADDLTAPERRALTVLARVRLNADGRPLSRHVADLVAWHDAAQAQRDAQDRVGLDGAAAGPARPSTGGAFDAVDGSYRFEASAASPVPRPWVNVLANPDFGALVSESGAGCTWAGNSRLHQLTAWGNDALSDMTAETFCVQALPGREIWAVGPGSGAAEVAYTVTQEPGRTTLRHQHAGLGVRACWHVDPARAVKHVAVTLHQLGPRAQSWRVLGLLEWQLGSVLADRQSVRTAMVSGVMLATQLDDHDGAGGRTAFVAVHRQGGGSPSAADWTCDRRELYDARGRRSWPDHLGRRAGQGADPCAAASLVLRLEPGEQAVCTFVIGHGESPEAALALAQSELARLAEGPTAAAAAAPAGDASFGALLGAVSVHSPDPLFDALVNHWLLYQTTACRLWGRAGFYQAGGAYGFRDQLQDAMALAVTAPQLLREHLLRAAARQFVQGDVQHWWHPHSGAGVRTRFSDDLLWLPHAVLHYVATSDDAAVWDESVPFLDAPPVPDGAEDAYTVPRITEERGSLFEHAARALDHSLATGVHGLPLMGGGDWNDGMNRVGVHGRGESVWLAWFLARLVADLAPVAEQRGEVARAGRWRQAAAGWAQALQGPAWDGGWYRRAFFDDGTPLGSAERAECRIDLVAQVWSVLSGAAPADRQHLAMQAAQRELAEPAHGLLLLLAPPLADAEPSAGYIQSYPRGVRENGGQYTHAVVWAAMAWAQLGDGDAAWQAWLACSPAHRAAHPVFGPAYGLEPYAVAADVYSQPPHAGRGGWSWYTGSAALLYRAAVGSICGLVVSGQRVCLRPVLPGHWPAVQLTLRRGGGTHRFSLCAATAGADIAQARAEGAIELAPGRWLDLPSPGLDSHHLVVGSARPIGLAA